MSEEEGNQKEKNGRKLWESTEYNGYYLHL